jgi:hypothetical protein
VPVEILKSNPFGICIVLSPHTHRLVNLLAAVPQPVALAIVEAIPKVAGSSHAEVQMVFIVSPSILGLCFSFIKK